MCYSIELTEIEEREHNRSHKRESQQSKNLKEFNKIKEKIRREKSYRQKEKKMEGGKDKF